MARALRKPIGQSSNKKNSKEKKPKLNDMLNDIKKSETKYWKYVRPIQHASRNIKELAICTEIDQTKLKELKITYLFDAINQVAMAKGVIIESIPTPFGKCYFKKLRGNNYIAKHMGVAQAVTTYRALLYIISKSKSKKAIEKKIVDFISLKVNSDFYISDNSKVEVKVQLENILNAQIKETYISDCDEIFEDKDHFFKKNFTITYKQAAVIFCGALAISETARSGGSGKMVRSGLKNGVTEFLKNYPRAKKKGNIRTSKVFLNKTKDSSIEDTFQELSSESTSLES